MSECPKDSEHGRITRGVSVFDSQEFIKAKTGVNVTVKPSTHGASGTEGRPLGYFQSSIFQVFVSNKIGIYLTLMFVV